MIDHSNFWIGYSVYIRCRITTNDDIEMNPKCELCCFKRQIQCGVHDEKAVLQLLPQPQLGLKTRCTSQCGRHEMRLHEEGIVQVVALGEQPRQLLQPHRAPQRVPLALDPKANRPTAEGGLEGARDAVHHLEGGGAQMRRSACKTRLLSLNITAAVKEGLTGPAPRYMLPTLRSAWAVKRDFGDKES